MNNTVYFYFCTACRNYQANADLDAHTPAHEAAIIAGDERLSSQYQLSFYRDLGETMFTCECCKARTFGERHMYAGKPRTQGDS